MTDWQADVRRFIQEVKHLDLPVQPTLPTEATRILCYELMREELSELEQAMLDGNMVEVADGLADLLYVTLYTANAYGIYMEPIFAEVQRSNMSKAGGPTRDDGKQLKPASYSPPNLAPLLEAQSYRPIAYIDDKPVAWQNEQSGSIVRPPSDS